MELKKGKKLYLLDAEGNVVEGIISHAGNRSKYNEYKKIEQELLLGIQLSVSAYEVTDERNPKYPNTVYVRERDKEERT